MRILLLLPVTAMLVMAVSCERTTHAAAAPKPLEVLVADVQQKDVPLYREWIGTLDGFVNAEIKAQVTGYLLKQDYNEGSFVQTGPVAVSDRPAAVSGRPRSGRRAACASARPVGAGARAVRRRPRRKSPSRKQTSTASNWMWIATRRSRSSRPSPSRIWITPRKTTWPRRRRCRPRRRRSKPIRPRSRPPRRRSSRPRQRSKPRGSISDSRASPSPIDGIPGIAQLQVGALVSPASGAITTVSTLDPIKVYFTVSEQEYLELQAPVSDSGKFREARARSCSST